MSPASSTKSNMHTLQTTLETYGVDWGGMYPASLSELYQAATRASNPYWKDANRPASQADKQATAFVDFEARTQAEEVRRRDRYTEWLGIRFYTYAKARSRFLVLYQSESPTRYFIYGLDGEGQFLKDRGEIFVLSNG
ncbi:MAG: hypothetical protein IV090_03495 [Candidatus Sericytochromatia bacterium]|nr:hypothetical protein [Candidatus Sericytochromatia bacterium]